MTPKLVFVIGAGASAEINLPVGETLKQQIRQALDLYFEYGSIKTGDHRIGEAMIRYMRDQGLNADEQKALIYAAWRIRDGLAESFSIDNFMDSHRADPNIILCGKLAIARCILTAEGGSTLFGAGDQHEGRSKREMLAKTWYNRLAKKLFENCTLAELPARLQLVAFVVFNYDRCLETYLVEAISSHYGATKQEAEALVNGLTIIHPYGTVGALPWQSREAPKVSFGHDPHADELIGIALSIKTFTEGLSEDSPDYRKLKRILGLAQRFVFLGFAFHRLNMRLLFAPGDPHSVRHPAVGTAKNVSAHDASDICAELNAIGGLELLDCSCVELFDKRSRAITFV